MAPVSKSEDARITELASRATKTRDRAQFRPTPEQKALLVRAALLSGQTLSDFIRTAVEDRAQRVLADYERITLGEQSRAAFFSALANPPPPNDRLAALAKRYASEVTSRP